MGISFTIILTCLLIIVSFLYWFRRNTRCWEGKRMPYVRSWPITGNLTRMMFLRERFSDVATDLYLKFGNVKWYGMTDNCRPTIVLKNPELIKDLFVKNFDNCPNKNSFVSEDMDPILAKNIISLRGDRWKEMRSTLSPAFTANKMKFMFDLVSDCSRNFVQYFIDNPEKAKELNMKDAFTRYTNDVIATTAFGISVDSLKNPNNEFYMHGRDATTFRGLFSLFKFFAVRAMPRVMKYFNIKFMKSDTDKFFHKLIMDTVKARDQNNIERPDMLHLLREARNNPEDVTITNEDIIAQAFIFFIAGFETVSTCITFATHSLAFNHDVQEKLRREIDEITASDGEITYHHLGKMKYMDMVIKETLRLYPPTVILDRICATPFTLPRAAPEYNDLKVEKDIMFWVPIYGMHRDPKYFPLPEKFNPERFSDENKREMVPYSYLPFGVGPRECIGKRFAIMETKIIIARLLQNFIINPTDRTPEKIEFERGNLNLCAEGGTWLNFQRRHE